MIFQHSLDFFVAFLACQILLAVPIVLPSPAAETITSDILSLIPIVEDATPDVILTHDPISGSPNEKAGALVQTFLQYAHQGLLNVDVFDEASGGIADPDEVWEDEEEVGAERLSLIQYTTGISGIPKLNQGGHDLPYGSHASTRLT
ncbi:hypothetical protein FRC02_002803 [Tulasnella sp. 418]|nr:hypothetical protein FRC02_002803 [Tulasnella sp. 418]